MSTTRYFVVGGYSAHLSLVALEMQQNEILRFEIVSRFDSGGNASFIDFHRDWKILVVANEVDEFNGVKDTGAITSFKVDGDGNGFKFEKIDSVFSKGSSPAFVQVYPHLSNQEFGYVFAANYFGGSYGMWKLEKSGKISKEPIDFFQEIGHGIHPTRQESSHPHQIIWDTAGKFLFIPDLGTDKILQYCLDKDAQGNLRMLPNANASLVKVEDASGPRHIVFHPNQKWAYLFQELDSRIDFYKYDSQLGVLKYVEKFSTLRMDGCNHSKNTGAEVLISPCGKFLYASNRGGFDSIVIFEIDQDSGMLKYIGYEHSRGEIPRFFMMDKSGELLLVANQDSDSLVLFSRNSSTGLLSYCGHLLGLERPTCIIEL